ncbi:hypothetical protein AC579_1041 [Pseudocercospora musae]|uniref:Uncharacterized protein n=1 Tax=Pseudocercospora musae TaxID=113226 RepID=A0A139HP23_9PEZI|nr:hypothetical protein AC579_1041 [Pseudocercospora musae]
MRQLISTFLKYICQGRAPTTAAARVFGIGELVEKILLYLPTKDLLLSKRINTTCRTAHEECIKIKKALFLVPGVANNTSDEASFPVPRFSASVTLLQKWWSWEDYSVQLPKEARKGVSFNPLLVKMFTGQRIGVSEDRKRVCNEADLEVPTAQHLDKNASCHKMFLTQPPLQVMTVNISIRYRNGVINRRTAISVLGNGVEMYGELLSDMERYLDARGADLDQVNCWSVGVKAVRKHL